MPSEKTFINGPVEEGERPAGAEKSRDVYGRVPPGGCAKIIRTRWHYKHELGPGKALRFLGPWGAIQRKSIVQETHFNGAECSLFSKAAKHFPQHVLTS